MPHRAGVAQLVEQLICNQQVVGSNPIASSIIANGALISRFFYLMQELIFCAS